MKRSENACVANRQLLLAARGNGRISRRDAESAENNKKRFFSSLRSLRLCGCFLFVLMASTGVASAHRLNVFAYVRGERIRVKAGFRRNSPARNCEVKVFATDGKLLHTLRTDAKGECDFRPAQITDLRIVANAGEGHQGEFYLSTGEPAPEPASRETASPNDTTDMQRLRGQIEAIQDQLAELRQPEGVRLQEVINGLCTLLGIIGASTLTWYFLQRRREKQ